MPTVDVRAESAGLTIEATADERRVASAGLTIEATADERRVASVGLMVECPIVSIQSMFTQII